MITTADVPKPPTTPSARHVADSAEHGGASSHGPSRRNYPDNEPPAEPYRDHAATRLEEHIRQLVAAAPPLTPQQRNRLAVLLRTTPPARGAA